LYSIGKKWCVWHLVECVSNFESVRKYIGNQAKQQLVKNAKNLITGFHNLLGKKFVFVSYLFALYQRPFFPGFWKFLNHKTAPVIQHPDLPDTPAYKVQVLQPSPSPLPAGSSFTTPAALHAPTPCSEPVLVNRILIVSEVSTIFLKLLIEPAEDFLGKQITRMVISVPSTFTDVQKDALASDAGVKVLQQLPPPPRPNGVLKVFIKTGPSSSSTLDPPPSR
jgi:heat shock protein 1/8